MGVELYELRAEHDPSWIVVVVGPNRVLMRLDEARDLLSQLGRAIVDAELTDAALRLRSRAFASTEPPAAPATLEDPYENGTDSEPEAFFQVAEITVPPRGGGGKHA